MENLHRHTDYLPAKKDPDETDQKPGYTAIPAKECNLLTEDHRPIDDSDMSKFGVCFAGVQGLTGRVALGADAEDEFGSESYGLEKT